MSSKPPIVELKNQIKELRKQLASLSEDISYIKNFIIELEKKDMVVINQEDDGDTSVTESSSGWFDW